MQHRFKTRTRLVAAAALSAIALTATAFTTRALAAARPLTYTTTDFAFTGPDAVDAGWTTFRIVNRGREPHQAIIVRLNQGKTFSDFMAAAGGPPPAWATIVGGPIAANPQGGRGESTTYLAPGNYAIICVIPSPDGRPHIAKGMAKPLTVRATKRAAGAPPRADVRMTLTDYEFREDRRIRPGRRTIEVRTEARQPHEVVVVELQRGKSAQDFINWVHQPQGAPPGSLVGGTALSPHQVAYFTATFRPNTRYAYICFFPDKSDGRPHFVHGMVREFTVQ